MGSLAQPRSTNRDRATSLLGPQRRRARFCAALCERAHLLLAAFALWALPAVAWAEWVVPIRFHVVERDGQPVASEAFLAEQLADANAAFAPLGVRFVRHGRRGLSARHGVLESRADRDALQRYIEPSVINCMVVSTLMDVDEPGRERRGVHWRFRSDRRRHFVVVSAIAGHFVLAHELGHFLGNRRHSATPGNLMSYEGRPGVPTLDAGQRRRVLSSLRALRASGEVRVRRGAD